MKLSMKLLTVLIVGVCQSLAAPKAELDTCHTEDYIKCALVIAGCSSTCTGSSVSIRKSIFVKKTKIAIFSVKWAYKSFLIDVTLFTFLSAVCLHFRIGWIAWLIASSTNITKNVLTAFPEWTSPRNDQKCTKVATPLDVQTVVATPILLVFVVEGTKLFWRKNKVILQMKTLLLHLQFIFLFNQNVKF